MAYDEQDDKTTKTIRVETVEIDPKGRYKIKSTGGQTYSFFKTTRDGKQTAALRSFNENNIQPGMAVEIWYRESQGEWQGKAVTYRNIITFKPALYQVEGERNGESAPPRGENSSPKAAYIPAPASSSVKTIMVDEARLEAEIIGKTATQFMAAAISAGLSLSEAQAQVDLAVMLAERLVNASKGPNRKKLTPVPPQPEQASKEDLAGPWDKEAELVGDEGYGEDGEFV
jgi:hypothetical protein